MSIQISSSNLVQEFLFCGGADLAVVDQLLPKSIHGMAERIGYANPFQVAAKLGGTSWAIPMRKARKGTVSVGALTKLANALGDPDLAALLRDHYEGEILYVPRCESALRAARNIVIHRAVEDGLRNGRSMVSMVKELATKFSLSDRRIWIILKEPSPTATLQPSIPGQVEKVRHANH
ncbi:Mor transcription activator family protein [Pseudomonas anguilliseptica]|uniref:Mor transcription activator family protein n=1 Tax=Pseudomonas anguilliseptica TaxID=53406 RepID=A0A1H5FBM5_PSEAG|nr:Mor transcription activator family protein [Pseudomonas anguilliseptica]SEE00759.1 Mor transcription activator family protein [Pseudomonas anguilliseptica]